MGELPDTREETESVSGDRDWPGQQERQREVVTEASSGGLADAEKLPVLGGQRRLLQSDFKTSKKLGGASVSNQRLMLLEWEIGKLINLKGKKRWEIYVTMFWQASFSILVFA